MGVTEGNLSMDIDVILGNLFLWPILIYFEWSRSPPERNIKWPKTGGS